MTLVVILVVLVGVYFVFGGAETSVKDTETGGNSLSGATTEVKVINVDASRFEFSPSTITVKKGDHVRINIDNTDTVHGITIPDFSVSGIDSVDFIADKTGSFEFRCPTMCGEGHRNMKGTLVVE